MPISLKKGSFVITLALTIVISSSLLPNINPNSFVVKALSKKDFLYPNSSSHNNDGLFYNVEDGHVTSNDNSSTTSSSGSSTFYLRNYSQITPSNNDGSKTSKNSEDDNGNHNSDNNNQNLQTSDNQDKHLNKLQQKIEKLQSRIDKLREQSRIQELENYGSKDSSPSSLSSPPPPAPTALTNSTIENNNNTNSTLQSLTTPPPAALSSSPASSHEGEHTILTQDNSNNKSSTTNWIFNDDDSNRNNYTYSTGLASSPLILPVGNAHTTSTNLSTNSHGGIDNSFYNSPSRQIDTKDIANNAITTPKVANNAITEAKLSRDAVHVVWDDMTSGNDEAFYRSNAGDVVSNPADDLSNTVGSSSIPSIAVSGNNVYVVWRDNTPGNDEVFYRWSTDGGATFGSTVNLSNNDGSSTSPFIAVSGSNVYVAWEDNTLGSGEIFYRRSIDGGATFGSTVNLSNNAGFSGAPSIAVSGNKVHIAWYDQTPGNSEIFYRRSIDGGATFGSTVNLSNNDAESAPPAIAVSGNNVYVDWRDNTPGNFDMLYRRSVDGGATFGSTVNLSNNAGDSGGISQGIAASGNSVYIVWRDNTPGSYDIFYRRSIDGGATFGSTVNLSNNNGHSDLPAIAASGSNIYVVWFDNTPGNFEIFLRKSVNAGDIFGSTVNYSHSTGDSIAPTIAVSPNNF